MRALVYPADGYISTSILRHLERTGHEIINWVPADHAVKDSGAAWDAALQQAEAVFHVMYGHEAHARDTVQRLLRSRTSDNPVTFLGITTPLTWAATPAPPQQQIGLATANSNLNSITSNDRSSGGGSAEDQHTQDGTATDGTTAAAPVLTERDASSRRSAAAALPTYHVEQLILRCNRPGRLHTYVLCPGILYGAGEDDGQLHNLFKTAWEGRQPLVVLGPGTNRLPTAHVADLASYAAAIAQLQPRDNQYLLYADDDTVQQRELVGAVGQLLASSKTEFRSPVDALLQPPPSPLLQLDLPFATTQLPASIERCSPRGLMQHLPQVMTEYLAARHLTPLRILIRGPPTGGKTYLAARLSELYGLMHINTAKILAELTLMDQDTQKAANAQLASKEGRISPQIFAKLAHHLLARHPEAANQGWVMEGWPKSLQAARLFCGGGICDGGGKGPGSPDRSNRRITGGVNKEKKPSGTGSSSGAAAVPQSGAKNRRTTMVDDPVDSAVTMQNPDLVPQYLIELEVPEDELLRRVKALAVAEAAAAAAAAALSSAAAPTGKTTSARGVSSKPVSAKGGVTSTAGGASTGDKSGGVAGVVGSHNNEKDWSRRMEAYKQLIQEDSVDLATNRAAILDAVRAATATPESTSSSAGSPGRHKRGTSGGGKAGAAAGMDPADLPPDVRLPEHGGFVAYFVESGCKYMHVRNTYNEAAVAAAAALIGPRVQPEQQQQQSDQLQPQQRAVLPPLHIEQQLKEWIGPPHNYKGFPDQNEHTDSSAAAANSAVGVAALAAVTLMPTDQQRGYSRSATVPGLNLSGQGAHSGQVVPQEWAEILEVATALTAEQAGRAATKLQYAAQPLMSTLLSGVMPALMAGLVKTALHRPDDPWQVIADELLKAAEQIEATYKDPYEDPVYALQLAKVEAKAAREAARAEAAAAKVAREEAARAAAAAQAEAEAAAAAAAATHSSYGTGGPAAAGRADQDGGSRPASAIGGGKAGAARSAAGKAAAAGGRPASSMKPR